MYHLKHPKRITKRFCKKYSHIVIKKDRCFRGKKVYTYNVKGVACFTAKPKQHGAKACSLKYIKWVKKLQTNLPNQTTSC